MVWNHQLGFDWKPFFHQPTSLQSRYIVATSKAAIKMNIWNFDFLISMCLPREKNGRKSMGFPELSFLEGHPS